MVRVLLNRVYYRGNTLSRGFVYFDESGVIDEGEEPEPEYELSELVYNFDYNVYVVHGFSVLVNASKYVFRGGRGDTSIFSKEDVKKIVYAALFELVLNGVTLPIVMDENPEIVAETARMNGLMVTLLVEKGTCRKQPEVMYIEVDNGVLYIHDEKIGLMNELLCRSDRINDKCVFLDISEESTWNISSIIYHMVKSNSTGLNEVLSMLTKPYRTLGLDNGVVEKKCRSDLLIYDLRNSLFTSTLDQLDKVLLRGYPPDYVFIRGDIYFEKNEALIIVPIRIHDIVLNKVGS